MIQKMTGRNFVVLSDHNKGVREWCEHEYLAECVGEVGFGVHSAVIWKEALEYFAIQVCKIKLPLLKLWVNENRWTMRKR